MIAAIQNRGQKLNNKRIWFLEHELDFQLRIRKELNEFGFSLENTNVTSNQEEVKTNALAGKIDILVSDYRMPHKDGITLLEQIRKENKDIILVLFTGFVLSSLNQGTKRCEEADIYSLHKFDGFESLLENLSTLINRPTNEKNIKEPTIIENLETLIGRFTPFKNLPNVESDPTNKSIITQRGQRIKADEILEAKDQYVHLLKKKNKQLLAADRQANTRSTIPIPKDQNGISTIDLDNLEAIEMTEALKGMFLEMSSDLMADLEKMPNQNLIIHSSEDGDRTIAELIKEIKEFSPMGRQYVSDWFKAEKLIRDMDAKGKSDSDRN